MHPARIWSLGDYATVGDRWAAAGLALVDQLLRPEHRVLDVACGPGHMAIAAAPKAATVTGVDISPSLLDQARARAGDLDITWREADMTQMPVPDSAYDVVVSSFGAMFASDPTAMAAELVRVAAPGATIGLLAWTPSSPIGALSGLAARYMPSDANPPAIERWGEAPTVAGFFDGLPVRVETRLRAVDVRWPSRRLAVDEITTLVPGWIMVRRALEPLGTWKAVVSDVDALFAAAGHVDEHGFRLPVEYAETLVRLQD